MSIAISQGKRGNPPPPVAPSVGDTPSDDDREGTADDAAEEPAQGRVSA